ncbi:MAG: hypothetical protein SOV59_10590 [Fusobacterium mortiferum]|nr:hypothetical protein [Fusobacterium mortiferum]
MRKGLIFFMFLLLYVYTFTQINISIIEPIRFEKHSTRNIGADKIVGVGVLEIYTDDKENDLGKKLVFNFSKQGLMTNRKKWIKVERFHIELPERSMIITQEREHIKVYAVINKRDIDKGEEADIIEGRYEGYIPIVVSQYGRSSNGIMVLPSFPDKDEPEDNGSAVTLPSFPDEDIMVLPEIKGREK